MKRSFSLFILIIFLSTSASATVDCLTVNHMTNQLFWADEDHSTGWIGWESIPDENYKDEEEKYLEMGYAFTNNAFLIEQILFLILMLAIVAFWLINQKQKTTLRFNDKETKEHKGHSI